MIRTRVGDLNHRLVTLRYEICIRSGHAAETWMRKTQLYNASFARTKHSKPELPLRPTTPGDSWDSRSGFLLASIEWWKLGPIKVTGSFVHLAIRPTCVSGFVSGYSASAMSRMSIHLCLFTCSIMCQWSRHSHRLQECLGKRQWDGWSLISCWVLPFHTCIPPCGDGLDQSHSPSCLRLM